MSKRVWVPGRTWASKREGASGSSWIFVGGCASEAGSVPAAGGDDEGGGGGGNMAQIIHLCCSGTVLFRGPNEGIRSGAGNHPAGVTNPLAGSAMLTSRYEPSVRIAAGLYVTSVTASYVLSQSQAETSSAGTGKTSCICEGLQAISRKAGLCVYRLAGVISTGHRAWRGI